MTEDQGERIIDLLSQIWDKLDNLDDKLSDIRSTEKSNYNKLKDIDDSLDSIKGDTSSIYSSL